MILFYAFGKFVRFKKFIFGPKGITLLFSYTIIILC